MTDDFFAQPILNSPYEHPGAHWELDEEGQPTNKRIESRRPSRLIVPVRKSKRRRRTEGHQVETVLDAGTEYRSTARSVGRAPSVAASKRPDCSDNRYCEMRHKG
jgi:type III restriction enzyme